MLYSQCPLRRCSEDCKWCAQSRHHHTGVSEYDIIREEQALDAARMNTMHGIRRFSLVTSGRKVAPADIENFCRIYRRIEAETPLYLCASMGLLGLYELRRLKEAGVKRYHCNLETSASYFPRYAPPTHMLTNCAQSHWPAVWVWRCAVAG